MVIATPVASLAANSSGTIVITPTASGTAIFTERLRRVSANPLRESRTPRKKPDIAKNSGILKTWITQKTATAQAPGCPLAPRMPAAWPGTSRSMVEARSASIEWTRP